MHKLPPGVVARTGPIATPHAAGWVAIATDGSSLGNPGAAGWAWVFAADSWGSGGFSTGTNNQAELAAILAALEATDGSVERLEIQTDSQYAIQATTKWVHGWKRRGWKTAAGKPVANQDLVTQIDAHLGRRQVKFVWVKGHSGHAANEAADARAHFAATQMRDGRDAPVGPGWCGAMP